MDRKEMKRQARRTLRGHYWILVIVCLFASFLGAEYGSSLWTATYEDTSVVRAETSDRLQSLVADIATDNEAEARDEVQQRRDEIKREDTIKALGRSRGVFSTVLNSFSSGGVILTVFDAIRSVATSQSIAVVILVVFSLAVYTFVWLFIKETYLIVARRMVLESRVYERVPLRRFLYPIQTRQWPRMAWNMFVCNVYQFLWTLTIVGGVVKHYSYMMVPYILAENPTISANEAITLSRRMMKGHKWECFVAGLSFLGWDLLNLASFGLVGIFYSNAYQAAFYGEYYAYLRGLTKTSGLPGSELMCDVYLFEKPQREVVRCSYSDVASVVDDVRAAEPVAKPSGFVGFLSQQLGIQMKSSPQVVAYEAYEARRHMTRDGRDIIEARVYPGRLAPAPMRFKMEVTSDLTSARSYTVLNLVMMFFIFCFVGWLWEVSLALITEGTFVNRGTLHGPWLPIYGTGGVVILVLLKRLRDRPYLEFIAATVLCGVLEYFSSWYLEVTHDGQRWWDYTGYFLNLNGRICAEGLLTFGLGGLAIVYVIAPALDNQLRKVNAKTLAVIAVVLLAVYAVDQAYSIGHPNSGAGITDYAVRTSAISAPDVRTFRTR
ncbi:DUF975 family protein [Bifidobacterium eulemuris]|uniref:DUF975 family protein n=1 Tax=Bifidobacterium eulemuris TaxID=1765219 RepID=A0A261GE29_9BIFI|nr:DUF975 family protein [Bifidobacterium eulemuris]OZG69226.1 hypothetical protein BEUL_0632 [Bifidobacterium eulemuris]QOL31265.1 DUF975 family protein [Bifidobacterium eulemuris]